MTAADAALLRRGFAEMTMQDVAARAGASEGTPYRHLGKEGLFAEVAGNRVAFRAAERRAPSSRGAGSA